MQVQFCEFPDDVYYDMQNDVWLRLLTDNVAEIGITSIFSNLAGRFKEIHFKQDVFSEVKSGQLIATVESSRFFGAIRSPLQCKIIELNFDVEKNPRLANDSPYSEGWITKVKLESDQLNSNFLRGTETEQKLNQRISELKIRCFKKLPDEELIAVGSECAAILVNLGDLLRDKPMGTVVHVLSDDPYANVEMAGWAELTKNMLIETRDEGNLHHLIVEKRSGQDVTSRQK
jgi:glycine cleavage system H protein